jgi:hypothetical protein
MPFGQSSSTTARDAHTNPPRQPRRTLVHKGCYQRFADGNVAAAGLALSRNGIAPMTAGHGRRRHRHRWWLPDGTGLHAPPGDLLVDDSTGKLCCHLCGGWYVSLGSHVRVHGYTAGAYRAAMGLCVTEPLTAANLSSAIAARQLAAYQRHEHIRDRLAAALPHVASGELNRRALETLRSSDPPQRAARRRAALSEGRATVAARRAHELAETLAGLGYATLGDYLRTSYADGESLESLARVTGLGRQRLRDALTAAGVAVRPVGRNTVAGKRSRAIAADAAAARRVGTTDLRAWLRDRQADGWSVPRLAAAVGHSHHWVRWRLRPSRESAVSGTPLRIPDAL